MHIVAFMGALIACSLHATTMVPTLADINQLRSEGKKQDAIAAFSQYLVSHPDDANAHFEFGIFLVELDNRSYDEEALSHLTRATELQPTNIQWLFTLGCQTCRFGKVKESLSAYTKILAQRPNQLQVLYNLGYTYKVAGETDKAIDLYKKVLSIDPNYEPAHLGLSLAYINKGDFENGWREHEWNLKYQKKNADALRTILKENTIAGKKILLFPEGGIGDTLHFIRYVQRLKHMGAYTIVTVQQALIPLISRCPYIDKLISLHSVIPPHDASSTFMSLAPIFADLENSIPQNIPYLFADPNRITYWRKHLETTNFKIGICWQPDVHNDVSRLPIARRGIPLSHFYMLGSTPGITLYSLQQKDGLDQLARVPPEVTLKIFGADFDKIPFEDTAAIMHSLDLIITTDTSVAHLAGALGRPVWLLLPYVTDWRWLVDRTDTPWYPTMRVFKQPNPYDWESVMNEVHRIFFAEIYHYKKD